MRLIFNRVHMYFQDNTFTKARCTVDHCALGIVTNPTLLQGLREAKVTGDGPLPHITSIYNPGWDPDWLDQEPTEWQKAMQEKLLEMLNLA